MDATAIQAIAALRDAANMPCDDANTTSLGVFASDFKLHNLEQFKPKRDRFRGVFSTESITDFVSYVLSHRSKDLNSFTKGFIETKRALQCIVFFNLGNCDESAGHADDKAILTLEPTPEYAAVLNAKSRMNQREFIDFLEDWSDFISPVIKQEDDFEYLRMGAVINAIRNMKITSSSETTSNVRDTGSSRSAMEEIEARSADTLPTHFKLSTTAYPELPHRDILLRFLVGTDDQKPNFSVKITAHAAVTESIGQAFKAVLLGELENFGAFLLGRFAP